MSAYTDFYDYLLPDLPAAVPQALATRAIRDAIIQFCERTRLYTYDHPAIDVVAATHTYTLTPEANAGVIDVLYAAHNAVEIYPAGDRDLDATVTDWRLATTTGVPEFYNLPATLSQIRLVPTPDESITGGLVVKIAQKPTRASTTVADWFLERFANSLMDGAKRTLYAMGGKPWSSPDLAVYHGRLFESACGAADMAASRGNVRAPLRSTTVYR